MLKQMFIDLLFTSALVGIFAIIIAAVTSFKKSNFTIHIKYWVWLILAVRLILPFNIDLMPIEIMPDTTIQNPEVVLFGTSKNQIDTTTPYVPKEIIQTPSVSPPLEASISDDTQETTVIKAIDTVTVIDILIVIWIIGVAACIIWKIISYIKFCVYIKNNTFPCNDEKTINLAAEISKQISVKQPRIIIHTQTVTPFLTGFFRPTIVIPENLKCSSNTKMALIHEMTHLKRKDLWYKIIIEIASVIHWFNPAVQLIRCTEDENLEFLCDEAVMKGKETEYKKEYAGMIISISQGNENRKALTTNFSGNALKIKERIDLIMKRETKKHSLATILIIAMLSILLVSCSSSAMIDDGEKKSDIQSIPSIEEATELKEQESDLNPTEELPISKEQESDFTPVEEIPVSKDPESDLPDNSSKNTVTDNDKTLALNTELFEIFDMTYSEVVAKYGEVIYQDSWEGGIAVTHENGPECFYQGYTHSDGYHDLEVDRPPDDSKVFSIISTKNQLFINCKEEITLEQINDIFNADNVLFVYDEMTEAHSVQITYKTFKIVFYVCNEDGSTNANSYITIRN